MIVVSMIWLHVTRLSVAFSLSHAGGLGFGKNGCFCKHANHRAKTMG
jgi:hypothetical protein